MDQSTSDTPHSLGVNRQPNCEDQLYVNVNGSATPAIPTHRFQSSNQNMNVSIYPGPSSLRMQCCMCHSFHSSSQDLHRHYVACHSPHELSSALLQQQCLPNVQKNSLTHFDKKQTAMSTDGDSFDRSQQYWNRLGKGNTASFSESANPGLSAHCQDNQFSGRGDPMAEVHGREIDGFPLVDATESAVSNFDVSLHQCAGSIGGRAKCHQKPTPQKIMSQMMGIGSEHCGDDWPDLGDDITLIDDEDLLSSLDLFPNLLDFVIELDAKEDSGTLTVQKPDMQLCSQLHLQCRDQHARYQETDIRQHRIRSSEKRIDAFCGKSVHECCSPSCTFCSVDYPGHTAHEEVFEAVCADTSAELRPNDYNNYPGPVSCSATLTHSSVPFHKHFHQVLGIKTVSADTANGNHNTCEKLDSYEHSISNHLVEENRTAHLPTVSKACNLSQKGITNRESSWPEEAVHFNASVVCEETRPSIDPSLFSNQPDMPLTCNNSNILLADSDASAGTKIRYGIAVVDGQTTPGIHQVDDSVSTNLKELSPSANTRDMFSSGMTAPCSIKSAISGSSDFCNGNEKRLPSFGEGVPIDNGQHLNCFAPRFITTQAPTRKHELVVCVGEHKLVSHYNADRAGLSHLSVTTSIPFSASASCDSNTIKSDCSVRVIPNPEANVTKVQLPNLCRNSKRRRCRSRGDIAHSQLEGNTSHLKSSRVSLRPSTYLDAKVVKTSSGRIVKYKQSDEFIYEKKEVETFANSSASVNSKTVIRKQTSTMSVKLTKAMMGTVELRKSSSLAACVSTQKSTDKNTIASVVKLPVYTDPGNDLGHSPDLVDKEGNTASSQVLSREQSSSTPKINSICEGDNRQQRLCHLCYEQYPTLTALTDHLKTGHPEWVTCYACRCGATFVSEDVFRTHWKLKHRDNFQATYTCRICQQTFPRENSFNTHLRVVHPDYKVICYVCEKRFVNMKSLRVHLAIHTKKQIFACPYCPKTYLLRYSFNRHFINHFTNLFCSLCSKQFKTRQSYNDHVKRHRSSKSLGRASTLKCDNCGDLCEQPSFNSKNTLDLSHHKVCVSCNRGLYKMFSMPNDSHELLTEDDTRAPASGDRSWSVCPHCQSSVLDLAKHVRRVHRQPRIPCDVCGALVKKECLPAHKDRAHTGLRKIPCDHCGKVFANALSLRDHINRVNNKIKSVLEEII